MPRDTSPSKEALSNRNLTLFLETISKKETQKAIESLSKIEKDEWKAMALTAETLNSFVSLGGTSELVTILTSSIDATIKLQIESLFSPLTNEINQAITDKITPFINDLLTPIVNDLNTFLSENQTGAGIGGIAGSILGSFVPGGSIFGPLVGAIVGGVIEAMFTADITGAPDLNFQELQDTYFLWKQQNPGGTFAQFYAWLASGGFGLPEEERRTGGPQESF